MENVERAIGEVTMQAARDALAQMEQRHCLPCRRVNATTCPHTGQARCRNADMERYVPSPGVTRWSEGLVRESIVCRNADNPGAWWCYFRPGAVVAGATLNTDHECLPCSVAHPRISDVPASFLLPEDE